METNGKSIFNKIEKITNIIFLRQIAKGFSLIKAFAFHFVNRSFLHNISKKEFSLNQILKFVKKIKSKQNDISNISGFNNISINININNNEISSPGEQSPKFRMKLNPSNSIINLSSSTVYTQQNGELSNKKESTGTSKSSNSNENNKKMLVFMKDLKHKLYLNGLFLLSELTKRNEKTKIQNSILKIQSLVSFKLNVHFQIASHISKKIYLPRFLGLAKQ